MNLSRLFIERPVATLMLVLALALFGALAYRMLPVNDLPQVDFPTLRISASLRAPIRRPWPTPWRRRSSGSWRRWRESSR